MPYKYGAGMGEGETFRKSRSGLAEGIPGMNQFLSSMNYTGAGGSGQGGGLPISSLFSGEAAGAGVGGTGVGAGTGAAGAGAAAGAAGGTGISPILAKILADAGGGLLSGIGAGLSSGENFKQWQQKMDARKSFFEENLKPQGEYYQGYKNMQESDWMLTNLLLGNLEERLGTDLLKKWGIDIDKFKSGIGLDGLPENFKTTAGGS